MGTSISYPRPPTSTHTVGGVFSSNVPVMRPIIDTSLQGRRLRQVLENGKSAGEAAGAQPQPPPGGQPRRLGQPVGQRADMGMAYGACQGIGRVGRRQTIQLQQV